MILLPKPPKVIDKKENRARFEIEALYPGYGITIGNSLRRVLLSSLPGAAVTQMKIKGEKEIKGSDFKLPSQVELVNKSCHLATLTDKKVELEMEVQIEKGIGYEPVERRKRQGKLEMGVIPVDAIFTPIKRVSFKVENMRVGERTDFDRLYLDLETDGTIIPEEAFAQAIDILVKHFSLFAENFRPLVEKKVSEKKPIPKKKKPKK